MSGRSPGASIRVRVAGYIFRFVAGTYEGGELPMEPETEITVGREMSADMVIMEDGVSRNHARISSKDGKLVLKDLGATNGTFVNGQRVVKQIELKIGDKIVIGQSLIRVHARP